MTRPSIATFLISLIFYTGERAVLKNAETHRCSEPFMLAYVLDNLDELMVKEVHGSGGYGMLVGPAASKKELAAFAKKLKANPGNYIRHRAIWTFVLLRWSRPMG